MRAWLVRALREDSDTNTVQSSPVRDSTDLRAFSSLPSRRYRQAKLLYVTAIWACVRGGLRALRALRVMCAVCGVWCGAPWGVCVRAVVWVGRADVKRQSPPHTCTHAGSYCVRICAFFSISRVVSKSSACR